MRLLILAGLALAIGGVVWWIVAYGKDIIVPDRPEATGDRILTDLERGVPEGFLEAVRKSDMATVGLVVDNLERYEAGIRDRVLLLLEQEGVVDSYISQLKGKDIEQKKIAAQKLALIGSPQAVRPLVEAIADKNEEVRLVAAAALKRIKDPAGIEPLIRTLKEPMKWLPARIAEVLVELGPLAVPTLVAGLGDPDPEYRGYIIEILGEIGDAGCLDPLTGQLQAADAVVRAKAVTAIGSIGGWEAVQALLAALADADPKVRLQAVLALRRSGDQSAAAGLARAAGDRDKLVRSNAVDALGRLGEPGLVALQQIAVDPAHPEKARAAGLLEK